MDRYVISHVANGQTVATFMVDNRLYGYPACQLELGRGSNWQTVCSLIQYNYWCELYHEGEKLCLRNRADASKEFLSAPRSQHQSELRRDLRSVLMGDPQGWEVAYHDCPDDRTLMIAFARADASEDIITLVVSVSKRLKIQHEV